MYHEKDLLKYEYFHNVLDTLQLDFIIDSLTGLINRKYMLDFIRELIAKKVQFTMAMVDLDNFKSVNDKYGHATGDYILENVGNDLITFIGNKGIVGRFGGDEFIMVLFGMNDYDTIYAFYSEMIQKAVFRKTHFVSNNVEIFVTGTIGSSRFPEDASNFDELFLNADKTLYRGKTKGRNCFIIYVESKHKDLQIQKMHNDDLPTMMFNINSVLNEFINYKQKCLEINNYLMDNLNLSHILCVKPNGDVYDMCNSDKILGNVSFDFIKFNNELAQLLFKEDIDLIFEPIKHLGISSLLITRLKRYNVIYGYTMFGIDRNAKIWETNETAILMYLAKSLMLEKIEENKQK